MGWGINELSSRDKEFGSPGAVRPWISEDSLVGVDKLVKSAGSKISTRDCLKSNFVKFNFDFFFRDVKPGQKSNSMSGLYLGDDFLPDRWDEIVPEEGFVVEQGELSNGGLVEVMGTGEEPIGGAASCSSEDVHKLVIDVPVKTYCSKRAAKREHVEKVLRD